MRLTLLLLFFLLSCKPTVEVEVPMPSIDIDIPDVTVANPIKDDNFYDDLNQIINNLESQNIMYSQAPGTFNDCSGIFHRVLMSLAKTNEFEHPSTDHRTTGQIGTWYSKQVWFTPITSVEQVDRMLEIGNVMFYGRPGKRIDVASLTIEQLAKEIFHIGIVAEVKEGEYLLFHGRSTGKVAKVTNYHLRNPTRDSYPPYGNGTEQLIAISRLR